MLCTLSTIEFPFIFTKTANSLQIFILKPFHSIKLQLLNYLHNTVLRINKLDFSPVRVEFFIYFTIKLDFTRKARSGCAFAAFKEYLTIEKT